MITAFIIIIAAVVADIFLFDQDRKRWGWMKGWSTFHKALFLSGFVVVTFVIYFLLSVSGA
ncbi:hypothetical protein [Halobacillus litoralis]|uniref:hypothetical protein n=1 Tax=Halobacillus litoralis TaxID=45668 RepID=UPI0021E53768